jgi:hypothetical protein
MTNPIVVNPEREKGKMGSGLEILVFPIAVSPRDVHKIINTCLRLHSETF